MRDFAFKTNVSVFFCTSGSTITLTFFEFRSLVNLFYLATIHMFDYCKTLLHSAPMKELYVTQSSKYDYLHDCISSSTEYVCTDACNILIIILQI